MQFPKFKLMNFEMGRVLFTPQLANECPRSGVNLLCAL